MLSVTTGAIHSLGRRLPPEVVYRLAILNAAHRGAVQGLHHPGQLRKSWYFFFFDLPELPKPSCTPTTGISSGTSCATPPAFTPEQTDGYIEAWSPPGTATGMIDYYRSSERTPPKKAEAQIHTVKAPTLVIWGAGDRYLAPNSPSPSATTPRPGPRRAPARRLALGPPRRGRARYPAPSTLSPALPAK